MAEPTWFHGSPLELTVLRAGSTITQDVDLARIFSHRPRVVARDDTGKLWHNGSGSGWLYEVVGVEDGDVYQHPETTMQPGEEWLTRRDLDLKRLGPTQIVGGELLSDADVEELRREHARESDPGDKMVNVRRMHLWHVLLVVAFVVGAALWLLLVPNDDPSGNARNAAYWWSSGVAAVALGALAHSKESALVGGAVGVPALLLAGWTAPRGDGDGLWILWFPILGALIFGLSAAGSVGGWLASKALARGRS